MISRRKEPHIAKSLKGPPIIKFLLRFLPVLPGLFLLLPACEKVADPLGDDRPAIHDVQVVENPHNVLSARVTVVAENAGEVYLRIEGDSLTRLSPAMPIQNGTAVLPLLGLAPEKNYTIRAIARSERGAESSSESLPFATGALSPDMPRFEVLHKGEPQDSPLLIGLTQLDTGRPAYAGILDNEGRFIWYRQFAGPVVDFQRQPNGNFTVFSNEAGQDPHFYELDLYGNILNEYAARPQYVTGPHEIRLLAGGHVLFGRRQETVDLSGVGGRSDALVTTSVVEVIRADESALYWDPLRYFRVEDAAADIDITAAEVNPWHGNAIEIDTDGHLLVSFRNCDEITKINAQNGEIIWRLGGKNNQFLFVDDPLTGFSHQHGVRRLPNGNIILFDNGNLHVPPQSRAAEYELDEANRVARLVWDYRDPRGVYGFALGFAQRLDNGNTLINYGTARKMVEVSPEGRIEWEADLQDSTRFVYRALRIGSIY